MRPALPILTVVALGSACADPTEVVIFVDTTLGVPCQLDRIEVSIQGAGDPVTRTADPRQGLESITVVRDGGGDAFTVQVNGFKGAQMVASARANALFEDDARRALPIVLTDQCLSQPCDFSSNVVGFQEPTPATRMSCEGISNQYTVRTTQLVTPSDACLAGVAERESITMFATDGEEKSLTVEPLIQALSASSFDFRFYGERIQRLWVADDGYVAFGMDPPGSLASRVLVGRSLTAAGAPIFAVSAFWDDLLVDPTRGGSVCLALLGDGDRETLWITWKNVCFAPSCATTDNLTFSVGLEEGTNRIIVGFLQMESSTQQERARGNQAAVGIRGPATPGCSASDCGANGLCQDGTTPCGFTQVFAQMPQDPSMWPDVTYELRPVPEN